jgi:hypothetical protein
VLLHTSCKIPPFLPQIFHKDTVHIRQFCVARACATPVRDEICLCPRRTEPALWGAGPRLYTRGRHALVPRARDTARTE